MIYIFIILLLLVGIFLFDFYKCKNLDKVYYWCMFVTLTLTAGLSYRLGIDTPSYIEDYSYYSSSFSDLFSWNYLSGNTNGMPGWIFLNTLFKCLGTDFYALNLFHSIIVNLAVFVVIRRYAVNIYTCLFLYFTLQYFNYNFEILKESLAVACFLFSIKYLINKDFIKYYLLALIALSFHFSALIVFIVPFFVYIKVSKKTIFLVTVFCLVILFFSNFYKLLLENMLSGLMILEDKINAYVSSEDYSKSMLSPMMIFNIIFHIIAPSMVMIKYLQTNSVKNNLFLWLILLHSIIYSITLLFFAFYRFNNYIIIFYLCFLSNYIRMPRNIYFVNRKMSNIIFSVALLLFIYVKISLYFKPLGDTNYPSYIRYYPYSSLIDKSINEDRERLHNNRFN